MIHTVLLNSQLLRTNENSEVYLTTNLFLQYLVLTRSGCRGIVHDAWWYIVHQITKERSLAYKFNWSRGGADQTSRLFVQGSCQYRNLPAVFEIEKAEMKKQVIAILIWEWTILSIVQGSWWLVLEFSLHFMRYKQWNRWKKK